ncbi:MAG: hypothetical protein ACYC0H_09410 [Solirubrobacteraceae bacterium]
MDGDPLPVPVDAGAFEPAFEDDAEVGGAGDVVEAGGAGGVAAGAGAATAVEVGAAAIVTARRATCLA